MTLALNPGGKLRFKAVACVICLSSRKRNYPSMSTLFIISIPVTDRVDILPSDDRDGGATLKTKSAFPCCLCVFVLLTEAGGS